MRITKRQSFIIAYIAVSAIYLALTMLAPMAPNHFKLTTQHTHMLELTIVIPVIIIWLFAFLGVYKFNHYTSFIKDHKDGQALHKIAIGFTTLLATIILTGLLGPLRNWAIHDNWLSVFTITDNYINAFLPLTAFCFMYVGSRQLLHVVKVKPKREIRANLLALFLIFVAVIYFLMILHFKYATHTPDISRYNSFYMSKPLIFLTLALPIWIGWCFGLAASYNLFLYKAKVKGIIYKSGLARLQAGIFIVVLFYIVDQLLSSFSSLLATISLTGILMLLYFLIILYGLGFLIIALGADRLLKIEQIK